MSGCRSCSGRLFHSVGPAVAKQRSPTGCVISWLNTFDCQQTAEDGGQRRVQKPQSGRVTRLVAIRGRKWEVHGQVCRQIRRLFCLNSQNRANFRLDLQSNKQKLLGPFGRLRPITSAERSWELQFSRAMISFVPNVRMLGS